MNLNGLGYFDDGFIDSDNFCFINLGEQDESFFRTTLFEDLAIIEFDHPNLEKKLENFVKFANQKLNLKTLEFKHFRVDIEYPKVERMLRFLCENIFNVFELEVTLHTRSFMEFMKFKIPKLSRYLTLNQCNFENFEIFPKTLGRSFRDVHYNIHFPIGDQAFDLDCVFKTFELNKFHAYRLHLNVFETNFMLDFYKVNFSGIFLSFRKVFF